jgi:hypothetical protein
MAHDDLALDEALKRGPYVGHGIALDERGDSFQPKARTEDTASAQEATCARLEALQTSLGHGEHGLRQSCVAFRDGSDELLEVERVSVRSLDELVDDRRRCAGSRGPRGPGDGCAGRQLGQTHLLHTPIANEARKCVVQLGSSKGAVRAEGGVCVAKGRVDESGS